MHYAVNGEFSAISMFVLFKGKSQSGSDDEKIPVLAPAKQSRIRNFDLIKECASL